MTTFSSSHKPTRPFAASQTATGDRTRPHLVIAEIAAEPAHGTGGSLLDDAPLPPTLLRLPDLASSKTRQPAIGGKWRAGEIAQWVGIGLGGLLAVWLIFGGRVVSRDTGEGAPAAAPLPPTSAAEAPSAPSWNGPMSAAPAHHATSAPATSAPMQPAPVHSEVPPATGAVPPPAPPQPGDAPGSVPEFDPYNQLPEAGGDATPEQPAAEQTSERWPRAQTPEPVYTALRPGPAANSSAERYQPSEAQPLDVTVPVPQ